MTFVHPKLRPLLEASKLQPSIRDTPVAVARAGSEERARQRGPGPDIHEVIDLTVPGADGHAIPIRIYRPERAKGVAIALHGGGWMLGSLDSFDSTARHIANDSGVALVSVDYRLAPEFPFPHALEDVWAVTCWVAKNGKQHQLNPAPLMLLGESAGANLAAVVAHRARDEGKPNIAFQVLVYPSLDARLQSVSAQQYGSGYLLNTSDMAYMLKNYGVGTAVDALDWRVSPLLAELFADLPPTLLVSAECDPLYSDAAEYAQRLLEAGVEATHVVYTGVTHLFFAMREALEPSRHAQQQVAAALRDAASR